MNLKITLFNQCKKFVENRLETIQETISSNQKALQSETKSSAGDKHETGRAMLQLEMEKAGQQLKGVGLMKETLSKIDVSKTTTTACLGSIIETENANYFLAISAGKLTVKESVYFAVSISSPIGKILLGKQANDDVVFNGKQLKIIQFF